MRLFAGQRINGSYIGASTEVHNAGDAVHVGIGLLAWYYPNQMIFWCSVLLSSIISELWLGSCMFTLPWAFIYFLMFVPIYTVAYWLIGAALKALFQYRASWVALVLLLAMGLGYVGYHTPRYQTVVSDTR
jgi:hypothetical protein